MAIATCPCGSTMSFETCCGRYHSGARAPTAEALMRSRYSAYALGNIDYLIATTLEAQRTALDVAAIAAWSRQSHWLGLDVREHLPVSGDPPHAWVTFQARWRDAAGEHAHVERSAFVESAEGWRFLDPTVDLSIGRNDPCPCRSGKKYKKCCSPFLS